jgi:hypothetical protein
MKSTINEYVLAFLEEHGSTDMIAKWNDEENQDSLEDMIPKPTKTKTKAKKTKDPNAPKKAKSSYMFFCADKREEATKQADDHKQVLKILGTMWSELKENVEEGDKKAKKAMAKYTKQADDDKERYKEEMEDYEPPTTGTDSDDDKPKAKGKGKAKAKKDPNAPKKPKSAYLIFCADKREEAKEELGDGAAPKDVLSQLGKMWAEAKKDPDEFNKYQTLADEDKARYKNEMGESDDDDKPKKAKKAKKAKSDSEEEEEDKPKTKSDSEEEEEEEEEDKPKKAKKAKKAKSDSEEDKPKKKVNAYALFAKENREQVKEENPDMDSKAITKELARQWKDLDDDEKQDWKDQADELNEK